MATSPESNSELHKESQGGRLPSTGTRRLSGLLIAGVAAGMLAGLAMGWISFRSPMVLYDEELVRSLFEKASPAVVEISITIQSEGPILSRPSFQSAGSGFLVDKDGHIVTNAHVVREEGDIAVRLRDGRVLQATKLGSSTADDLALLQVEPAEVVGISPLPLADSDKVRSGEMAIAIGSSFRDVNSVTVGVVSGVRRSRDSAECIWRPGEGVTGCRPIPGLVQTDAALNPGNSGGPLLNSSGEVIGVNSSVQVVRTAQFAPVQIGVGFAIPSNTLSGILQDLMIPGELKRPWIGISGVATENGIHVTQVVEGSPADKGGLIAGLTPRHGDVITAVDGRPVISVTDMVSYFNTLRPGDQVTLTLLRDSKTQKVKITLTEWMNR